MLPHRGNALTTPSIAYAELRLILAKMIWNFDWELMREAEDWMKQKVFVLWEKPPLMLQLRPVVR